MTVSEATFRKLALEDPSGQWELHCGVLRQKPPMTAEHNGAASVLFGLLFQQLDGRQFKLRLNLGHVRRTEQRYYIPDVFVIPAVAEHSQRGTGALEVYEQPLPLVVEVWSPSTGDYDVEVKLVEYQRRGDLEIWRIHPYDRTLTSWVRQANGRYSE